MNRVSLKLILILSLVLIVSTKNSIQKSSETNGALISKKLRRMQTHNLQADTPNNDQNIVFHWKNS